MQNSQDLTQQILRLSPEQQAVTGRHGQHFAKPSTGSKVSILNS